MKNIDRDYECIDLLRKLNELNNMKNILVYDSCHPIKNYFVLRKQNESNGFFSEVIKLKNIWIYYFMFCITLVLCTCFIIPISIILSWNTKFALQITSFIEMFCLCLIIFVFIFYTVNSRAKYERLVYKIISRINLQIYRLESKIINLQVYQ